MIKPQLRFNLHVPTFEPCKKCANSSILDLLTNKPSILRPVDDEFIEKNFKRKRKKFVKMENYFKSLVSEYMLSEL